MILPNLHVEARRHEALGHLCRMQRRHVQDIRRTSPGEQRPSLAPIRPIIIQHFTRAFRFGSARLACASWDRYSTPLRRIPVTISLGFTCPRGDADHIGRPCCHRRSVGCGPELQSVRPRDDTGVTGRFGDITRLDPHRLPPAFRIAQAGAFQILINRFPRKPEVINPRPEQRDLVARSNWIIPFASARSIYCPAIR